MAVSGSDVVEVVDTGLPSGHSGFLPRLFAVGDVELALAIASTDS